MCVIIVNNLENIFLENKEEDLSVMQRFSYFEKLNMIQTLKQMHPGLLE